MDFVDIIIRDMACKYKIDQRIMRDIVFSPLLFTKRVIKNNQDNMSVRIPHFGMFTQKNATNKAKRLVRTYERIHKYMHENPAYLEEQDSLEECYAAGDYDSMLELGKRIGLKFK